MLQRELADLVEEDRALVGGLELADLVVDGAGEGALDVAEELRLDQGLGDRAAVDGDQGAAGARRSLVDLAGDQLLAGAGLAGDHDGDVDAGDLLDAAVDVDHLRAGADDLAEADALEAPREAGALAAQLVEELGVLDEERGLGGEDAEGLESGLVKRAIA
jgi:hypothetical protein